MTRVTLSVIPSPSRDWCLAGYPARGSLPHVVLRLLALPLAAIALGTSIGTAADTSIQPLPAQLQADLSGRFWHKGCPVALADLRVLTVTHWGFDGRRHTGQLVVNKTRGRAARAASSRSSTRCASRSATCSSPTCTGPSGSRPADDDVSASFECRQAVPSPCTGGKGTGTWSNHAYGLAVDLNPAREPLRRLRPDAGPARPAYLDRSRLRPGMVTPAVVARVRLDRLGLGRRLGRVDEGLHALLRQRALAAKRVRLKPAASTNSSRRRARLYPHVYASCRAPAASPPARCWQAASRP